MARLAIIGLSHKTAPIEVRERLAVPEDQLAETLRRAVSMPGVGEAMILSTCNRVEIYAGVDGEGALQQLSSLLSRSMPASTARGRCSSCRRCWWMRASCRRSCARISICTTASTRCGTCSAWRRR
jgi:glutamyl-tRNA reductase